jgi:hypothetical protein
MIVKRLAVLVAAAAATLAVAAPANAKNISELALCGPDACAKLTDASVISRWAEGGNPLAAAPAPIGAFYRFDVTVTAAPGEHFDNGRTSITWSEWYVPRRHSGLIRSVDDVGVAVWTRVDPTVYAAFSVAVRGLDPYPPPRIVSATVGRTSAADPGSYARLFDPSWQPAASRPVTGWRTIRLRSASPSPWTDGKNVLLYSPRQQVLSRDDRVVKVPGSLAAALAHGGSLGAGGSRAPVELGAAGIATVLAAGVLVAYRRRRARTDGT